MNQSIYGVRIQFLIKVIRYFTRVNNKQNVSVWILGVIGTVLIAGLITLIIWKVCTTIHDRKEYAKFVDEKQKLNWHTNQNPLYKGAISEFNNPVYNRGSRRFSFKQRKSDE